MLTAVSWKRQRLGLAFREEGRRVTPLDDIYADQSPYYLNLTLFRNPKDKERLMSRSSFPAAKKNLTASQTTPAVLFHARQEKRARGGPSIKNVLRHAAPESRQQHIGKSSGRVVGWRGGGVIKNTGNPEVGKLC